MLQLVRKLPDSRKPHVGYNSELLGESYPIQYSRTPIV